MKAAPVLPPAEDVCTGVCRCAGTSERVKKMYVTREVPPGSGRYRVVSVPDPKLHPKAAPGFDCARCGLPIGKNKTHFLIEGDRVVCVRCLDKRGHTDLFPACPHAWHDGWDHDMMHGTRAGIAAHLGLWPRKGGGT